jgi:hypothetical protein
MIRPNPTQRMEGAIFERRLDDALTEINTEQGDRYAREARLSLDHHCADSGVGYWPTKMRSLFSSFACLIIVSIALPWTRYGVAVTPRSFNQTTDSSRMAHNCMSVSCPRLPRAAFTAQRLDSQLDAAAREFVGDDRNVHVDREQRETRLSAIFKFYTKDFLVRSLSLAAYINRYRTEQLPPNTKSCSGIIIGRSTISAPTPARRILTRVSSVPARIGHMSNSIDKSSSRGVFRCARLTA